MVELKRFFGIQINPLQCILSGQYILADRFLRNSGYPVELKILLTLGGSIHPKKVLRNLKIPKFA